MKITVEFTDLRCICNAEGVINQEPTVLLDYIQANRNRPDIKVTQELDALELGAEVRRLGLAGD